MAAADAARQIARDISVELLAAGYVFSFVDFFSAAQTVDRLADDALVTLKALLGQAEEAQQKDDAAGMCRALIQLGAFFEDLQWLAQAHDYYARALAASLNVTDDQKALQIQSLRNVGRVELTHGQHEKSLERFELARVLSKDNGQTTEWWATFGCLKSARINLAEMCQNRLDFVGAVEQYRIIQSTIPPDYPNELAVTMDMQYRLGIAFITLGDTATAEQYLETFRQNCQRTGDHIKLGLAQAALAECFDSNNEHDKAIACLTSFLDLTAGDTTLVSLQASACNQLGMIHNRTGEYATAEKYFDRYFSLNATAVTAQDDNTQSQPISASTRDSRHTATTVTSTKLTTEKSFNMTAKRYDSDSGSVQLGIARGNAELQQFLALISRNDKASITALLEWKRGVPLKEAAAAAGLAL